MVIVAALVYAAMGAMARLIPQIQVFFILLPIQLSLGFIVLALTLVAGMLVFAQAFERGITELAPAPIE